MPQRRLIRLLLPLPLAPTTATQSPASICRSMFRNAAMAPPSWTRLTPRSAISGLDSEDLPEPEPRASASFMVADPTAPSFTLHHLHSPCAPAAGGPDLSPAAAAGAKLNSKIMSGLPKSRNAPGYLEILTTEG